MKRTYKILIVLAVAFAAYRLYCYDQKVKSQQVIEQPKRQRRRV